MRIATRVEVQQAFNALRELIESDAAKRRVPDLDLELGTIVLLIAESVVLDIKRIADALEHAD